MRIAIGSDERTYLTDWVVSDIKSRGILVITHGALTTGDNTQWAHVGRIVAESVSSGLCDYGILFCWTGTGVTIAANKVLGIRAALCSDMATAKGARRWNDANVLGMSLRRPSTEIAREILDTWFATPFDGEDSIQSIRLLDEMDRARVYPESIPQ